MPSQAWYRSLYWRIAIGFVALLAVLLIAQGALFLYLTDRIVGRPARTPAQLADVVATAVSGALSTTPNLDLEAYVRREFSSVFQPFLVGLMDGRRASNRPTGLPPNLEGRLRMQLMRRGASDAPSEPWSEGGGRRGGGPGAVFAPILVDGELVGAVAVPATPPPFSIALSELGPTLTWFGLFLLGIGATVTALLIFRPAHQRLRALEQAARALGEGRTDVRAIEGGDEVGSLAKTFNTMAVDLASRARELEDADRVRRQLLADVSHELMTPLTAIRGYAETLAMQNVPLNERDRERYLGVVIQETNRLEAIIGELLDLARLEGGGDALTIESVPIEHLFGRVRDRHDPVVRERRLTLVTEIAPGTPAVRGDGGRLEQALQNLAANAIRHTPEEGAITLKATSAGNRVRILVQDTGPGIPPEHLPRVFDRFYKVDAARAGTSVPSGSGLGLSIVRAIVERHGGAVRADNVPGGGAVFEILLPSAR